MARISVNAAGVGALTTTDGLDPVGYYERLRELGDPVWDETMNAWLVVSYDLLKQLVREEGVVWGLAKAAHVPPGLTPEEWEDYMTLHSPRTLHASVGEDHDRQHRWWMRTFSGRTVRLLGDTLVRPVANAQLDRIVGEGRGELHRDFAVRIAPRVVATAMGLPWDDDEWVDRLVDLHERRIALISRKFDAGRDGASDEAVVERGRNAVREAGEMVRPYVRERRSGESEDFIGMIWRDGDALFGPGWDEDDVVATVNLAFSGGSGTTAATAASALYLLLTRPGLQERLRAEGGPAVAALVEETIRLYGPLPYRTRRALRATELGGVRIAEGELVIAIGTAANRDAAHYPVPHEVELERRAPRDHFNFGIPGTRACPGQGLARTQLTTILSVVLERLAGLRLDPDAEPPAYRGSFVRTWAPLNAIWR
jgi:cytochrome P450